MTKIFFCLLDSIFSKQFFLDFIQFFKELCVDIYVNIYLTIFQISARLFIKISSQIMLRRKNMVDKLYIIKQILETDEDTDIKILSILELAKENPDKENIHRIEERMAKRKKIMIEVSLNMEKEKVLAETEDISSTGAFIRTNKKVGKGEHISIKLTDPKGEEFTFVAKVMRVNPDGIGVMVKTISLNDRDNLTNFLDRL